MMSVELMMMLKSPWIPVCLLCLTVAGACGVSDRTVSVAADAGSGPISEGGSAGEPLGSGGAAGASGSAGAGAGAGGEGGAGCSASTCDGVCLPSGECELLTVGFTGHVQHYEILEAAYQANVTVEATNIATMPAPISKATGADGAYSLPEIPRGAFVDLELTWPQTGSDGQKLPLYLTQTRLATNSMGEDATHQFEAPVVSFNWLAQVAVDCGIFPDLSSAELDPTDSTKTATNPFWVSRSTIIGDVRDAAGKPQAGIAAGDIHVKLTSPTGSAMNPDAADTAAHPTKICFLKAGPGGTTLVGGTGTATDATGRFVAFRVKNDKGTGSGVATVSVTGHADQVVSFKSSGQVGIVQFGAGPSVAPPRMLTGKFATDVYPLFTSLTCRGCHSPGNPGYESSTPRGPNKLKADYSGSVDDVYQVIMATNGGDCSAPEKLERVCLNDPANSLLTHMPFAEPPPAVPDHETTYFNSTEDPDYQAIFQWIKGGAKP